MQKKIWFVIAAVILLLSVIFSLQSITKNYILVIVPGILVAAFAGYILGRISRHRHKIERTEEENAEINEYLTTLAEQLQAPMNDISELLYITDTNTYELLFLNKAGQSAFCEGSYYGKKCYKVLQDRDSPCPFCNNEQLKMEEYITWEHTNEVNQKHYLLKDRLIRWDNRKARMEIAFDMTEQENERNKTRYMLEAEQILVGCIRELYKKQDIHSGIYIVLKMVGEFLTSDRAYIFKIQDQLMYNNYEWCHAGVKAQKSSQQGISVSFIERWTEEFQKNGCMIIDDMEQLQGTHPKEYEVLKAQGISRMVVCPLESNGTIQGFMGVDNPPAERIQSIATILQTLCYFILLATTRDNIEKQLAHMSYYDALTGFFNRNRYMSDIKEIEKQSRRIGIVYLDINGLKDINDMYGHAYGDEAIVDSAKKMRRVFCDADIYRIGGDEFVIISLDAGEEQFMDKVRELKGIFQNPENLQIALGIKWSEDSGDVQKFISDADASMYEDKRSFYHNRENSRRYRHYNDEVLHLSKNETFKKELKEGKFLVYLQPKICTYNQRLVGAEALVRYQSAGGKIILPNEFLPLLEAGQSMADIDFYVFENVCRQIHEWIAGEKKTVPVSVNISIQTMVRARFVSRLLEVCERWKVPTSLLEIEISEHSDVLSDKELIGLIGVLKQNGFRVSLDDFGTEYANLALLSFVEFDILKLDRSIVNELGRNERTKKIVMSLVKLCNDLNIQIIAEGIETKEQLDTLTSCGIVLVQGYYYSYPLTVTEYEHHYL